MIIYEKAKLTDISEISDVHIKCFEGYFLCKLGKDLLEKYYAEFYHESDLFVIAKDADTNKILGFCMGYYYGSQARADFESKYKVQLAKKMFKLCLRFDKETISKCFDKVFSKFKKAPEMPDYKADANLLSICVLPDCRGLKDESNNGSVAYNLVLEFEKVIKDAGSKNYTLWVKSTNDRARAFYNKCGMYALYEGNGEVKYAKEF